MKTAEKSRAVNDAQLIAAAETAGFRVRPVDRELTSIEAPTADLLRFVASLGFDYQTQHGAVGRHWAVVCSDLANYGRPVADVFEGVMVAGLRKAACAQMVRRFEREKAHAAAEHAELHYSGPLNQAEPEEDLVPPYQDVQWEDGQVRLSFAVRVF